MTPFAIAGVQMHISSQNNLHEMSQRLDMLMHLHPWVQMVVFSELAPFGPSIEHAQVMPGCAEDQLRAMAKHHGVWLIPGSMFELNDGLIYNTLPVINPEGEIVTRYRKVFPFMPYEVGVSSGDECLVFDVPEVGCFGLSICYDLWFPETTRTLVSKGAEVILHPVLTNTIDRDVELHIARASAAMFQAYVFDINGLGAGGNGRSCVIDPSGRALHQSQGQEEFIPIEIDLDQVRRQRERGMLHLGQPLKSFRDRKADFAVYNREIWDDSYLQSLGPLTKPDRAESKTADPGDREPTAIETL